MTHVELLCCIVRGAICELHVVVEVDHEAIEQTKGQIIQEKTQEKTTP